MALQRAILTGDPAEDAPVPAPRSTRPTTNLPAPVSELVGRDPAVRRVRESLTAARLVTLTGPGGVGKTSVALAVARALVETFPEGVWLVDLTAWDGRGDPAELVLSVLSIPDAPGDPGPAGERLAAALRGRRTLLVLDNCEHVIEPVAELVGGRCCQPCRSCGCWPPAGSRCGCAARSAGICRRWTCPTATTPPGWRTRPPCACSWRGPGWPRSRTPSRGWPRCAGGWTASRWRWSWPPPGLRLWACGSWRRACACQGTGSGCSAPGRATRRPGSARSRR
ncbi:hypothetical protein ACFSTC_28515 [Nonomuraea ferruginea]